MSLINDALKRAKQAQQPHSPDAPQLRVQFRPVEPSQQVKRSNTGIWIAVVIIAGLICGFVIRQVARNGSHGARPGGNCALRDSKTGSAAAGGSGDIGACDCRDARGTNLQASSQTTG